MVYLVEVRETPTYTRYEHIAANSKAEAYQTAKEQIPDAFQIKILTEDYDKAAHAGKSVGAAMVRRMIAAYENNF